jgi:peptide/nickel transport system permease protein
MGLMLQLVFGVWLHVFPVAGRTSARTIIDSFQHTGFYVLDAIISGNIPVLFDVLDHLFLPSITLGVVLSGVFIRLTRANMLDTLRSDFIVAAHARGIPSSIVTYRHGLKNAFVPILTMLGLQFAILLSGAIITETTFSWPGIGRLLVERIYLRDYPVVQGVIVIFALMVSAISLIVDLLYAFIDPRVKY